MNHWNNVKELISRLQECTSKKESEDFVEVLNGAIKDYSEADYDEYYGNIPQIKLLIIEALKDNEFVHPVFEHYDPDNPNNLE